MPDSADRLKNPHNNDIRQGGTAIANKQPSQPKPPSSIPAESTTSEIILPQSIIDSFARFLVPEIRKYYESEDGQRALKEWSQENDTE